jgi:transcriptional regulator with XRE-family HTH domain
MTQAQLGERLSRPLTRTAIANIETGKQRVLALTLVEIARVAGVPLDDLVPETTPPTKTDLERKLLSFNVPGEVARALAATASDQSTTRRAKR